METNLITESRLLIDGRFDEDLDSHRPMFTALKQHVLLRMRLDKLAREVKSDTLIIRLDADMLKKLGTERACDISQKMCQLGLL